MMQTINENKKQDRLDKFDFLLIGLFTGIFLFMPISIGVFFIMEYVTRELLNLRFANTNIDDLLIIWFCLLPVAILSPILGVLGGIIGGKYSSRGNDFSTLGAMLGGILAALIIAISMNVDVYYGWMTYK